MMQFCAIFCDIFKVEKKSPDPRADWLLFPAQTEVMASDRQKNLQVSEETQKNLKKLLVQYPDGIVLTKCLDVYEQRFRQPLKILGPTSASLADVFSSLTFADVETRPHPINPINNIQMVKAKPDLISLRRHTHESEKKKKSSKSERNIVLVENLADSVSEEDLKALFSHFGQVSKVRLNSEQKAQIYMDDQASATKAVAAFNKQKLDGQQITCQFAVPPPMNNQQQPHITKTGGQSNRVMISNLPRNMSFERISAMTTACGNVRTINVNENGTAIVEFANTAGAENFIRANNRKIIDRSLITVSRLA